MSKSRAFFQNMNRAVGQPVAALGWLVLSVVFLFSLNAPVVAQSEDETGAIPQVDGRRERRRERAGGRGDGLMERLNLSPEQREQIRTIRRQTNAEARAIAQRLRQARRALDEAVYLENADESVIETRAREVATAQAAAVRLRAITELKIRRLLTPEQLNTLREIRQQAIDRQQEGSTQGNLRRMRRGLNRPTRPDANSPLVNEATPQPTATPRERRNPSSKPRP